jgi:hypothetical protein
MIIRKLALLGVLCGSARKSDEWLRQAFAMIQ